MTWMKDFQKWKLLDEKPLDLDHLNDPIAASTQWSSICKMTSNTCPHRIKLIDTTLLRFMPSFSAHIFSTLLVLISVATMLAAVAGVIVHNEKFPLFPDAVAVSAIALGFVIASFYIIRYNFRKIRFDKGVGYYVKGSLKNEALSGVGDGHSYARLIDIHAIQLLSSTGSSGRNVRYRNFEINLVLHDGRRLHITSYGNSKLIRKDAITLAEFLGVRVWDGIVNPPEILE